MIFYLVYQKKVQPFKGDLDDYYQWLQNRETGKESTPTQTTNQYREKKSLQNRLKKLEQIIDQFHQRLSQFETMLSDLSLYEEGQQKKLQTLLNEQKNIQQELLQAEEEWLEIVNSMEESS